MNNLIWLLFWPSENSIWQSFRSMKNDCVASATLYCRLFLRYLPSSWLLFVSHPHARPWLWFRKQEKRQTASGYNLPWNLAWASVSNKHCRLLLGSRPWYTDRTSDVFNTINHGAWFVQASLPAHLFGDLPHLSAREDHTRCSMSLWFNITLKSTWKTLFTGFWSCWKLFQLKQFFVI